MKDYAETLTISGSNDASAQVALSFSVVEATHTLTVNLDGGSGSTTDYYRLTFETNGGSEIACIRRAEYSTIDLTDYTPTREGYEFTGWYADEDLTEKTRVYALPATRRFIRAGKKSRKIQVQALKIRLPMFPKATGFSMM